MNPLFLQVIQLLVPAAVEWFRNAHGNDPKYKDYTPGQIVDEMINNASRYIAEIDAWEASHPRT